MFETRNLYFYIPVEILILRQFLNKHWITIPTNLMQELSCR